MNTVPEDPPEVVTPKQEDRFDNMHTDKPPKRGDSDGQVGTDEREIVKSSGLLAPGILAG